MLDQNGKPRDYYVNIENYQTPIDVDKTKEPNFTNNDNLGNVANPIKNYSGT